MRTEPTADLFPEVAPHNGSTDENQRFTIPRALDWCRRVVGVTEYDLDVAACDEAHHAPNFYDGRARGSGLLLPWYGDVFCNPPWDDIGPWVMRAFKAWREPVFEALTLLTVSMLLPGNRTHRDWWRDLVEPNRDGRGDRANPTLDVHFAPERFPYGGPGNPKGIGVGEPNFTSVLLVWRAGGTVQPIPPPQKKRKQLIVDPGALT
jgi:hypothetical protein